MIESLESWYRVAKPRKEVREGRSFSPDEFAIALEQVVAGTAPEDYREPDQFFSRTYFTSALSEHVGMVLRRLAGKTENTSPVLTLITQFGGGKTHTLTTLYHLIRNGGKADNYPGVNNLLKEAGISSVPKAKVAVFVGNAWDPREGRETPWLDIARQLAGDDGVAALGASAKTVPPGTEAIGRLFEAAGGSVLILLDEVLNLFNRYHQNIAEPFHAFIQNLTVAATGTTRCAVVISLPRSQVEMTEKDILWQEKITKVVRRVAKDLIANNEAEISEVVRRRLFEHIGNERIIKRVSGAYADWCFERRAQLPPEWTAVNSNTTEFSAREFLQSRFEACYPFHPATLSVFQRKWQALSQYQQTRGTLAMLAQWVSLEFIEGHRQAKVEPLITLGSAPLGTPEFRAIILGQLGEPRLLAAIEADISGDQSHARALDTGAKEPLIDIHRKVATAILFESSGGQADKVAHLPELRFALGKPEVDTTSIDTAAMALETKAFFIWKVGVDGFKIRQRATLRKVVSDRRASLDEETEIKPAMQDVVRKQFEKGANIPPVFFPDDSTAVQDIPKLTMVVMEPTSVWSADSPLRELIAEWTNQRGKSPRLYPGSLIWCLKKPGRELREKIELWLAWKRVVREDAEGLLGIDYDPVERAEIQSKMSDAENAAKDEVWGGYRFVVLADNHESHGLKVIDLGAGHASCGETLCGRIITALKSQALLNESIGAGYIERHWPPTFKESGAWPLKGLRQSFLNGSLTRLIDPDTILRNKIVEFINSGNFGLASGVKADGTYERVWYAELIPLDEVVFETGVFLLTKAKATALKNGTVPEPKPVSPTVPTPQPEPGHKPEPENKPVTLRAQTKTLRLVGIVPPEVWNRLGTKLIPKLKSGSELKVGVDFSIAIGVNTAHGLEAELRQILDDLGLQDKVRIEDSKFHIQ